MQLRDTTDMAVDRTDRPETGQNKIKQKKNKIFVLQTKPPIASEKTFPFLPASAAAGSTTPHRRHGRRADQSRSRRRPSVESIGPTYSRGRFCDPSSLTTVVLYLSDDRLSFDEDLSRTMAFPVNSYFEIDTRRKNY